MTDNITTLETKVETVEVKNAGNTTVMQTIHQKSSSIDEQFSELKVSVTSSESIEVASEGEKAHGKKLTILDDLGSDDESDEDFKPASDDESDGDGDSDSNDSASSSSSSSSSSSEDEGHSDADSDKSESIIDKEELDTLAQEAAQLGVGLDLESKVLRTGRVIKIIEDSETTLRNDVKEVVNKA
ncbi:hypothetical protein BGZ98_009650 [Dissophora globulifera]|nr:hypothetical protein BGZ98_009650 [Dissophora globulifera]